MSTGIFITYIILNLKASFIKLRKYYESFYFLHEYK